MRIVAPLASAFTLFVAMALTALRRPYAGADGERAVVGRGFGRYLATLVGPGYAAFLTIVAVFHVLIAGERGALKSAAAGGAFLALVVAVPASSLAEWLGRRRRGGS